VPTSCAAPNAPPGGRTEASTLPPKSNHATTAVPVASIATTGRNALAPAWIVTGALHPAAPAHAGSAATANAATIVAAANARARIPASVVESLLRNPPTRRKRTSLINAPHCKPPPGRGGPPAPPATCGAKHAIGAANGTDALTIALRAMGVGPGDDVVVLELLAR
jgi:hypothetical protein